MGESTQNYIRQLTNASELLPCGFIISDWNDGKILAVNSRLWRYCECSSIEEFLEYIDGSGKNLVHPDDRRTLFSHIQKMSVPKTDTDQGNGSGEENSGDPFRRFRYRILTKSGQKLHVEDICCASSDLPGQGAAGAGTPCVLHYLTITDDHANQNFYDPVSGLHQKDYVYQWIRDQYDFNRESFMNRKIAAVYINCRGFRRFNGSYGYEGGDSFLRQMGQQIRRIFDTSLCARLYGDRFTVFCRAELAEEAVRRLHTWGQQLDPDHSLSIVAGIFYPGYRVYAPEAMNDRAKLALDQLSTESPECFCVFTDELEQKLRRKEYIQTHIDQAVSQGWLRVWFQPIIRSISGKVCGVEALARWKDPFHGMISPGEFVPALEEKGLSWKLALFMIDHAAKLIHDALAGGYDAIPVSINFSRQDFEIIDPYEEIEKAVRRYDIPRSLIAAEITESMAMECPAEIKHVISELHQAGYEVWMDDFGSAYSTLNSLKDFQFDQIKMDMVFLQNLNERGKKIISSCIQMAKYLRIHTLCEGVETPEQVRFLRDLGCEKLQGFWYSRPMEPVELSKHLKEDGFQIETPEERQLYDAAGHMGFDHRIPWTLIQYDGTDCWSLYTNERLRNGLQKRGYPPFPDGSRLDPDSADYLRRIVEMVRTCNETGETEEVTYFAHGHYYSISVRPRASECGRLLCQAVIRDTTEESQQLLLAQADTLTQGLVSMYSSIYRLDLARQELHVILSDLPRERPGETLPLIRLKECTPISRIDRERFQTWMKQAVSSGPDGSVGVFRFDRKNGETVWFSVTVLPQEEKGCLMCFRPCPVMGDEGMNLQEPAFPPESVQNDSPED